MPSKLQKRSVRLELAEKNAELCAKGEKEYKFCSLKNDQIRMLTVADEVMKVLRKQQERQKLWALAAGDEWNNADNVTKRVLAYA